MGVAYSVGEVDHLYTFFVQWSPSLKPKHGRRQNFVVVNKDQLTVIDGLLRNPFPENNWQIITVKKARCSPNICSSLSVFSSDEEEVNNTLPVLKQHSHILLEHHIQRLVSHLPARIQCCLWQLVYSTEEHGTSLRTLYRCTAQVDRPVLLLIKDMHNQVFGVFSSHPFRVSNHCYGTGETFLFTFSPEFKTFCWSGENSYFVRGFLDSLQIGGGGGPFGLWVDADLYHGTTFSCKTFHNQPLAPQHDFIIQASEVWTFQ